MRLLAVLLAFTITAASARNVADDQFKTLSTAKQKELLARTVTSSGEKCRAAKVILSRGRDKQDHAYYAVRCSEGGEFNVQIKSDANGSTVVADCALLKRVGSDCWKVF